MGTTQASDEKRRLLAAAESCDWLRGVGIARLDGGTGLVVSVRADARAQAEQFVAGLSLAVPYRVREVGEIRARNEA